MDIRDLRKPTILGYFPTDETFRIFQDEKLALDFYQS